MTGGDGHQAVLLKEAVEALAIKPDGVYVDCTYGRGGHSSEILRHLGQAGTLVALDRDLDAIRSAQEQQDSRLTALHARFSELTQVLAGRGIANVDGILMDLGVSSPQLEDAARGFSFRRSGPLDMRMDQSRGMTAAQWLGLVSEDELAEVIKTYGEERFAKQIARSVVAAGGRSPIETTGQLAAIVAGAVKSHSRGQDPATRTFQAIRIFLNRELEELAAALAQGIELLAPLGRLVVISFHSLEDRIVKRFLREQAGPPALPERLPVRAADMPQPRFRILGKPIVPTEAEVARNPRARSAIMRVVEKRLLP